MQAIACDRREYLLVNTQLRLKRPSRNWVVTDQGYAYQPVNFIRLLKILGLSIQIRKLKSRNTMFNVKQCLVSQKTCVVILALEMTHSYWFL